MQDLQHTVGTSRAILTGTAGPVPFTAGPSAATAGPSPFTAGPAPCTAAPAAATAGPAPSTAAPAAATAGPAPATASPVSPAALSPTSPADVAQAGALPAQAPPGVQAKAPPPLPFAGTVPAPPAPQPLPSVVPKAPPPLQAAAAGSVGTGGPGPSEGPVGKATGPRLVGAGKALPRPSTNPPHGPPHWIDEGFVAGYKLWVGDIPGTDREAATQHVLQALGSRTQPEDINVRPSATGMPGTGREGSGLTWWAVLTYVDRGACEEAENILSWTAGYTGLDLLTHEPRRRWLSCHFYEGTGRRRR